MGSSSKTLGGGTRKSMLDNDGNTLCAGTPGLNNHENKVAELKN